jgi:hypothetical protein
LPVCCSAASAAAVELVLVRELVDAGAMPAVDRLVLGRGAVERKRDFADR